MELASTSDDVRWMRAALALAKRGIGNTAPNPSVGCILVRKGRVIGRGWTQLGGRPHAESMALDSVSDSTAGATAYVTLEPCAHTGQTPPCAEALIKARIARIVVACRDPDPRVSGRGISILSEAGVEVTEGVLADEAKSLNAGFFYRVENNRPYVTVKTATTADCKIALANGESQWITGQAARSHGHMLRYQNDAILTGIGTVLADDPELTCRTTGLDELSPTRVILDRKFRIPETAKLLNDPLAQNTILFTEAKLSPKWFKNTGAESLCFRDLGDIEAILIALAERGINRLLVEAGAAVTASFIKSGLVDEICQYVSGKVIGSDGLGAIGPMDLGNLAQAPHFIPRMVRPLGGDFLIRSLAPKD